MESAYGIGVANRYALFLDSEDDASSADPYALLATAAADAEKLGVPKGGPGHHGPAAAAAGKGAPGLGAPRGPGAGAGGKPGQKPGFGDAGALSESKANVNANQKDAGEFLFLCTFFFCVCVLCPLEFFFEPSHNLTVFLLRSGGHLLPSPPSTATAIGHFFCLFVLF